MRRRRNWEISRNGVPCPALSVKLKQQAARGAWESRGAEITDHRPALCVMQM